MSSATPKDQEGSMSSDQTGQSTITVKTLVLDKKRMPLGIYKQLPCQALINHDGILMGAPWGTVNVKEEHRNCTHTDYFEHGDRQEDRRVVVWESDGQLFRDLVLRTPRFPKRWDLGDVGTDFVDMHILESERNEQNQFWPKLKDLLSHRADNGYEDVAVKFPEMTAWLTPSRDGWTIWNGREPRSYLNAEGRKRHEAEYAKALAKLEKRAEILSGGSPDGKGASSQRLYSRLQTVVSEEPHRRQRHKDLRNQLFELPQLFIGS